MQMRYIGMNPRQAIPAVGLTARRGKVFEMPADVDVALVKGLLLQTDVWEACDDGARSLRDEALAEWERDDRTNADADITEEDEELLGEIPPLETPAEPAKASRKRGAEVSEEVPA